ASALTEIKYRVWELGWNSRELENIDSEIMDRNYRPRLEQNKIERYAKKYGWIGYNEKAGVLMDSNILSGKSRSARGNPIPDIDPSFPGEPSTLPSLDIPSWVTGLPEDRVKIPPD
ncbi:MAG: hypothetical protein JKY95_04010, partial [Planctomycetaceae bacterium]|nr:hypothetical protein [Planctomycetaceae bacterium]